MGDLLTRAEVASTLRVSERTLRRFLPQVPDLSCHRIGRTILFAPRDVQRIREAFRCRYPSVVEATSGTRAARSASVGRRSASQSSAQDAVRELTRKLLQRPKKRVSEPPVLRVMRGMRDG